MSMEDKQAFVSALLGKFKQDGMVASIERGRLGVAWAHDEVYVGVKDVSAATACWSWPGTALPS